MIIRNASLKDLDSLVRLWREMMVLHYRYNSIFKMKDNAAEIYTIYAKRFIEDKTKKALVVEESNKIIGYVFCEIVRQPPVYEETRIGNITEICVDEQERRKGVGKSLVNECINWLKKNGIKRIDIMVARDNPISQEFWRKVGFDPYNDVCYMKI